MSSSLPDGYVLRDAREDELDEIARLVVAEETALSGSSTTTVDGLRIWFRMARERWAVECEGRLVAGALLIASGDVGSIFTAVDPGERAIRFALLEHGEAVARERGHGVAAVSAAAEDEETRLEFERRGYTEARHFFEMKIELDEPPPTPNVPEGLLLDTFAPADAPAFHAALNEAFQEEWGWVSTPFEDWLRLRADDDKSVWLVMRDGDELAGVARCEPRPDGGFVGAIGVRPAWRRRGIALALLQAAFAEFHRRGGRIVRLGVDAENPTGATRLYERVGMEVASERIFYEKRLG